MNKKLIKGFTLIEMLVVIAIISILAGIVLTGVGGFQANARDTKRIGDLRIVQNYLELYFNRWGHYPGNSAGAVATPAAWSDLATALNSLNVSTPNDPVSTRTYYYSVETVSNLGYILGVKLERGNNVLTNQGELDTITGGYSTPAGMDCVDATPTFGYCIGS